MAKKKKKVLHVCEPFHSEAKDAWIVRYTLIDGSRKDVSRKDEEEAWDEYKKLEEITNRIGFGTKIDQKLITLLLHVIELSEEQNLKPREVVQEVVNRLSNAKTNTTVAQAWKKYKSEDFENKYSKTTKGTNRPILNAFSEHYDSMRVGDLTCEHAFEYSAKLQGEGKIRTTIESYMGVISGFLDWCKASPQKFIKTNTFTEWTPSKLPPKEHKAPKILNLADSYAFTRRLIESDPMLIPAEALRMYAGMRTCEVKRIDPSDVDILNRKIYIGPEVAKKGKNGEPRERKIENLDSPLWQLLEPFMNEKGKLAYLDIKHLDKRHKAIMIHIGAIPEGDEVDNELRHCFATYSYHREKNDGQVRAWLGHRSSGVLWLHYVNARVEQADAVAYFMPPIRDDYHGYIQAAIKDWKIAKIKSQKKPSWPSDTVLAKLVWEKPRTKIASDLGVSEAAVRKRCTKLGIEVPGRGYWR